MVKTTNTPAPAYEPPGLKGFAQGRRQPNLVPEDFPDLADITDPGEDAPPQLNRDETQLKEMVIRAVDEYGVAHATAWKGLAVANKARLYRDEFKTFGEFAENKMEISRAEAYRRIDHVAITEILSPIGDKMLPVGQTRELATVLKKHGPEAVKKVWDVAAETVATDPEAPRKITGEVLKEVRENLFEDDKDVSPIGDTIVAESPTRSDEKIASTLARELSRAHRLIHHNQGPGMIRLVAESYRSEFGDDWCQEFARALHGDIRRT